VISMNEKHCISGSQAQEVAGVRYEPQSARSPIWGIIAAVEAIGLRYETAPQNQNSRCQEIADARRLPFKAAIDQLNA